MFGRRQARIVRIHPKRHAELNSYVLELAAHRSAEELAEEFARATFGPYGPVRDQLLAVLRAVNRTRKAAGFDPARLSALHLRRRQVCSCERYPESESFGLYA